MTISTDIQRDGYPGNGATKAFATTFPFFDAADVKVLVVTTATGAEAPKTLATDYTVSGGAGTTGTVTMTTAPAVGETLRLILDPVRKQTTELANGDGFDVEAIERQLDRLTLMVQRLDDRVDRAPRLKDGDPGTGTLEIPFARASSLLGFDASKNLIAAAGTLPAGSYSAFVGTLLDDASASAFLDTLGFGALGKALANDADAAAGRATLGLDAIARNYQVFTSSGSFAKSSVPAAITHVVAHVWGGGGGGGGGDFDGNFRAVAGAGGGYARKRIAVASLATNETVTVGAGGTAGTGANSPGAGGNGGTSSFGSFVSATGGTGGTAAISGVQAGVAGGAGSSGGLNLTGGDSSTKEDDTVGISHGGDGAMAGGTGAKTNVATNGRQPGGGATGGNHSGGNGGVGGAGLVIVEW